MSRLRDAIRAHVAAEREVAESTLQLARVVRVTDLTLELFDSGLTLHDDEFDLSQLMRAYSRDTGFERNDTVVVVRKATGGEIHWLLTDVVGDTEPFVGGVGPEGPAGPQGDPGPPGVFPGVLTLPFQAVEPGAVVDSVVLFSRFNDPNQELCAKWPDGTVTVVDSHLPLD